MIELQKELNPHVVFSPSTHDVHQDHVTIANECMRAFKKRTILQYEIPWNNYSFNNQFFYCVDEEDVERKVAAINCYSSQRYRDYTKEDFTRGQLLVHGVQIGETYAEVFEAPHLIAKDGHIF